MHRCAVQQGIRWFGYSRALSSFKRAFCISSLPDLFSLKSWKIREAHKPRAAAGILFSELLLPVRLGYRLPADMLFQGRGPQHKNKCRHTGFDFLRQVIVYLLLRKVYQQGNVLFFNFAFRFGTQAALFHQPQVVVLGSWGAVTCYYFFAGCFQHLIEWSGICLG